MLSSCSVFGAGSGTGVSRKSANTVLTRWSRSYDGWGYLYYNATRLAGYATLRASKLDDARMELTGALATMPRSAIRQRAVFMADLATLELRGNDIDRPCALADDAAGQLDQAGYATGASRLHEFRAAVDHWKTSTLVRTLDEQLAALG